MPIRGFLAIPNITGSATQETHEGEIPFAGIDWSVQRQSSGGRGSGRHRGRSTVHPITIEKAYDQSSPYLALAALQGKSFDEIVLSVLDDGEMPFDYLVITLKNATIAEYGLDNDGNDTATTEICEIVDMDFEEITVLYRVQADDGGIEEEHEIAYNVVTGA